MHHTPSSVLKSHYVLVDSLVFYRFYSWSKFYLLFEPPLIVGLFHWIKFWQVRRSVEEAQWGSWRSILTPYLWFELSIKKTERNKNKLQFEGRSCFPVTIQIKESNTLRTGFLTFAAEIGFGKHLLPKMPQVAL